MRNIVVTGGTRGLGLAIARHLAAQGDRVIAVARSEPEAFAALRRGGGEVAFVAWDLRETATLRRLVGTISEQFGAWYGLVNNAGIGTAGMLATMPEDDIAGLLQLNLASPLLLTKYAARRMMANGAGGRIVNLSSIVATTGYGGLSVYSATKAALQGFTRSLARELGPLRITVNCVAPGFIATEMTGGLSAMDREKIARRSALGRLAQAEDVAAGVAYLLSEQAGNVTGTTLTVDAGATA